jgi:hypothetical protein
MGAVRGESPASAPPRIFIKNGIAILVEGIIGLPNINIKFEIAFKIFSSSGFEGRFVQIFLNGLNVSL